MPRGYKVVALTKATAKWPLSKSGKPYRIIGETVRVTLGFFPGHTEAARQEAKALLKKTLERCESSNVLSNPRIVKVVKDSQGKVVGDPSSKFRLRRTK